MIGWLASAHASGTASPPSDGLVPPSPAYSAEERTSLSPGLWPRERQLGLRMQTGAARRGEMSTRYAGGMVIYGGTRIEQPPDIGQAGSYSGLRYPLSANWSSTVEASIHPAPAAAARAYSLVGRLDRTLPAGWGLSLGLRRNVQEYRAPVAQFDAGTWAYPLGQGLRHAYPTTSSTGYELRLSYRYGERNSLGLSYSSVRDFDVTLSWPGSYPAEGRQYSLTGQHWLTPDWSLSYGLVANEQGGPRGPGLRLGLRYSF